MDVRRKFGEDDRSATLASCILQTTVYVVLFTHARASIKILIRYESLYVSENLPTYPSPKPTFCPKWEVRVNVSLGRGREAGKNARYVKKLVFLCFCLW